MQSTALRSELSSPQLRLRQERSFDWQKKDGKQHAGEGKNLSFCILIFGYWELPLYGDANLFFKNEPPPAMKISSEGSGLLFQIPCEVLRVENVAAA